MTKSQITLVTLAILLLFTSAYYNTPADGRVGYQAPELLLGNEDDDIHLNAWRGQYVLVTFWASAQPESRIANMRYDRAASQLAVKHLSVNLDESERLWKQLVAVDGLAPGGQRHCELSHHSALRRVWRQNGTFCSFLIATDGKIVSKNPSLRDLRQL